MDDIKILLNRTLHKINIEINYIIYFQKLKNEYIVWDFHEYP